MNVKGSTATVFDPSDPIAHTLLQLWTDVI